MTFTYPAVFTPHKNGKGYHAFFPDLECCEADGPDLEDAIENARDAACNWITVEMEEFDSDPSVFYPCGGYKTGRGTAGENDLCTDQASSG